MDATIYKQEGKHQRGKNFSASDDRNICFAWISLSHDPLNGTDQQPNSLWKDMQEHAKLKNRNWDAVRQRWGHISRSVAKFVDCYDLVMRKQIAGASPESLYNDAVTLYLNKTNNRVWKFKHCWEILRYNPKFNHAQELRTDNGDCTKTPSFLSQQSPADEESFDFESNAEGPFFGDVNSASEISIAYEEEGNFQLPNKWERQSDSLDIRRIEALEALANAAERKNELIEEYTRAINNATDVKIITTSGKNLDSLSLKILEMKKVKILTNLQNESKENKVNIKSYLVPLKCSFYLLCLAIVVCFGNSIFE